MISTPVLIIGAGPSGMVSALLLAKNGIPSVLVEKRAIPGKHPKAHEISGRTLEILNTAGIPIEELESEASPHEDGSRIIFCRTIKEEIGRVDLNDPVIQKKYQDHSSLSSPYLNLSQTALESIIRKYVLENKLITYKNNCEWVSFEKTNQKIISKLNFEAKEILIESEYTLCCEGAGGQCRNALGITMKGPEKIREFANVYFTNDLSGILPTKAKLFFIFRPDSAGILIAHHSKKRWVYHVPLFVHEKISDYTESKFISNLQKIFDDPTFIPEIESISSWSMTAQIASSFSKGRIFLIGDSAHRFPPSGGLGLNSGVADAHNLCWKLSYVLNVLAEEKILKSYEIERKPVIQINCEESLKNYHKISKTMDVFGLNVEKMERFLKFLTSPLLSFLPKKLIYKIISILQKIGDKVLQSKLKNPEILRKAKENINSQVGHFDRIGLDLGVIYETKNTSEKNIPTEYHPKFIKGARLPHFLFQEKSSFVSSHTLIEYSHFILICSKENKKYEKILKESALEKIIKIKKVPKEIQFSGVTTNWSTMIKLSDTGAILVRPDGHILECIQDDSLSIIEFKLFFLADSIFKV